MGDPKLSLDEQKAYDRWKKVCEHNFKRLSPTAQFTCVVQKKQLEQDAKSKRQALATEASFQVERRKIEALMYVSSTVDARQAEATILLGALMRASAEYDQILQARAASPVLGEILTGLALSLLPELKVLGRVMSRYAGWRSWRTATSVAAKSSATSWEKLADEVMNAVQAVDAGKGMKRFEKFAEALDGASKDIIEAVGNPLEANKKLDEASRQRLAAWRAKNQILSQIIRDISRTLTAVAMFEPILYRFILWYNGRDLVSWCRQRFIDADLDSTATKNTADYDLLESLILYDMLRVYTKMYFRVRYAPLYHVSQVRVDEMPDSPPERDVEGLDEAQRKMIYDRFGKVPWRDASRPGINSYKDLIKYWQGTVEYVPPPPAGYLRPG
jgi:hypothetical protein